jgi:hypothetical protein
VLLPVALVADARSLAALKLRRKRPKPRRAPARRRRSPARRARR